MNFDSLPKDRPATSLEDGRYTVFIKETKVQPRQNGEGTEMIVTFEDVQSGLTFREWFIDNGKQFNEYKINRLSYAANVALSGEGTLGDVAKCIQGISMEVEVVKNDKGWANLSFQGDLEGMYPVEIAQGEGQPDTQAQTDAETAIEYINDSDEEY